METSLTGFLTLSHSPESRLLVPRRGSDFKTPHGGFRPVARARSWFTRGDGTEAKLSPGSGNESPQRAKIEARGSVV